MGNLAASARLGLDGFETDSIELRPNATEDDLQTVIRAVYKQILGNEHVMDSQRLESAEAQLRDGKVTVRGFVKMVAKSSFYQSLFFHGCSQYRFIELNYKHFLGRPPQDQAEISEHVAIYNTEGYEAEIESYLDSDEYFQNFGENIVPYPRSIKTQTGVKNEGFNRMFTLLRGSPTNDSNNQAKLITSIAANVATSIKPPAIGNGAAASNLEKRYRITYSSSTAAARLNKYSKREKVVDYTQMSQEIQAIHQAGGKITSICEAV